MKHHGFLFLMASLLPVSAPAQIADSPTSDDLPHPVAVARCAYTQTEASCKSVHAASQDDPGHDVPGASGDTTLAQIPRRMPGPPLRRMRPPMGGPAYPSHVAISAQRRPRPDRRCDRMRPRGGYCGSRKCRWTRYVRSRNRRGRARRCYWLEYPASALPKPIPATLARR